MMSMIIKFFRLISSEADPAHISVAFGLAMIAGFTPLVSLHNLVVIFLLLVLRVNIAAFVLALAVFSGFAYLLDPFFHLLGQKILLATELNHLFTEMYNSTFWRLTNFNNTILMGSLVISLTLFVPVILLANRLIKKYRQSIVEKLKDSRLFKLINNNKFVGRMVSVAEKGVQQ